MGFYQDSIDQAFPIDTFEFTIVSGDDDTPYRAIEIDDDFGNTVMQLAKDQTGKAFVIIDGRRAASKCEVGELIRLLQRAADAIDPP